MWETSAGYQDLQAKQRVNVKRIDNLSGSKNYVQVVVPVLPFWHFTAEFSTLIHMYLQIIAR